MPTSVPKNPFLTFTSRISTKCSLNHLHKVFHILNLGRCKAVSLAVIHGGVDKDVTKWKLGMNHCSQCHFFRFIVCNKGKDVGLSRYVEFKDSHSRIIAKSVIKLIP